MRGVQTLINFTLKQYMYLYVPTFTLPICHDHAMAPVTHSVAGRLKGSEEQQIYEFKLGIDLYQTSSFLSLLCTGHAMK